MSLWLVIPSSFLGVANVDFQRDYAPGSLDAKLLKEACEKLRSQCPEIPVIVGGKEVRATMLALLANVS